jgi:hypothetical protein
VNSFPGASHVGEPAIEYFTLDAPETGDWVAHVRAMSGSANFALVFTAQSSIRMDIFFDRAEYPIGGSIGISAVLEEGEAPITEAVVMAEVTTPTSAAQALAAASAQHQGADDELADNDLEIHRSADGTYVDNDGTVLFTIADLVLFDDGGHGDGDAGDGVYANYFEDTNVEGTYSFRVTGSGDSPSGVAFTREASQAAVVSALANSPPVADAGDDQTLECLGFDGALATLDGSGSFDPDGDPLTFTWSENGSVIAGPTGNAVVDVTLSVGEHTIELNVEDGHGGASPDEVLVAVEDTTPPSISVTLNRYVLWPPNHKMADIWATVTVTDICCPTPTFALTSVTSNEPDDGIGDGDTVDDIQDPDIGTSDTHIQLRSERSAQGDGRVYTIVYTAEDCAGNTTAATAEVRVPHDQSGHALASMGFAPTGRELDSALDQFVLVIPSAEGFDATALDVNTTYVGNSKGAILPDRSLEIDNNADELTDLAVFYSAKALSVLLQTPDEDFGPLGLHYTGSEGVDYLVRDIFKLGEPVPLVPEVVIPWSDDTGNDGQPNEIPDVTGLLPS